MKPLHLLASTLAVAGLVLAGTASAASTAASSAMTVTPGFVSDPGDGPGGCGAVSGAFVCHVSIHNPSSASLAWRAWPLDAAGQGTLPATVTPSHGTLAPGASVRVTISTAYCGFSLADLANFLGWSGASQAGAPPQGGAVLYSCG